MSFLSHENQRETYSWSAHPARERVHGLAGAALVIASTAIGAWISFGWPWALLWVAVLMIALNRFFFPSRFAIDAEGITASYPLRRQRYRWSDLRRFVLDRNGGYLSSRGRRSALDAYSGMHLLFGANRQEVIDRIRARMPI